jgi:hypothetical protein
MRAFVKDAVETLRAFARECWSPAGQVLLGYVLLILTHRVVEDDPRLPALLSHWIPYAGDGNIRKIVLDVIFFGLLPLFLIVAVHRKSPVRDFGLRFPSRPWVLFTALIFAVQLVGILITAQIPAIRDFYPYFHPARQGGAVFWGFEVVAFLSMASWEFINHGYLTLGLKERLGLLSVLVGAVPFGILHFGKPVLEIYYSVLDGMGLALLAYACGSIWPGVWLHGVGAFLLDVTLVYITPPRPPLH